MGVLKVKKVRNVLCVMLAALMVFCACQMSLLTSAEALPSEAAQVAFKNKYAFVFVHGLNGWGGDEGLNGVVPYWGASTGDLMQYLNVQGYECYSASVGPISSAWDRACELYAQLTGSMVDYGAAHSAAHNHYRYGRTYSEPLIKDWGKLDYENKLIKVNLVGHSFGGTAIRMLTYLLKYGEPAEVSASPSDVSPLFTGGKGNWVNSMTTVCTPHNSATIYFPLDKLKITKFVQYISILYAGVAGRSIFNGSYFDFHLEQFGLTNIPGEHNADKYLEAVRRILNNTDDTAQYDITPEGAQKLNKYLKINDEVYYFSYAFKTTVSVPVLNIELPKKSTNPVLFMASLMMGVLPALTDSNTGIKYGKEWRANDGLCSTISETYPFDEAHTDYNSASVSQGVWNVMPVSEGDHGTAIGLLVKDETQTHDFYLNMLQMLIALED